MAVTYTTAAARDARRVDERRWQIEPVDLATAGTAVLALMLIAAAYHGIFRETALGRQAPQRLVNVNTAADARTLEAVFEPVMPAAADRRLAARVLFEAVAPPGGREVLPNVGAIARLRVTDAAIDKAAGASGYRARLAEERARAKAAGREPPRSIPLLTSAQLSDIKPGVAVRDRRGVRRALVLWLSVYLLAFPAVLLVWRVRRVQGDRLLLAATHVLTAVGFAAMISRQDPLRDLLLFPRYVGTIVAGLAIATLLSCVSLRTSRLRTLSYVPLVVAFALSMLLLVFGDGPSGSNAKVNLGPFQPIELIRILLALFLAGYFARHWELLRAVRTDTVGSVRLPSWVNAPAVRYVLPVFTGVAAALVLFFIQRDLGPALMLAIVFLAAYAVARGTVGLALAGGALLIAGFYVGYQLDVSATLAERVRMWFAPWDNAARGGDQVAQALWSMSSGGWLGSGVGLGDTRYLPAGHTDLVIASVAEELGFAGLAAIACVYSAMVARALSTARRASTDYAFFLAIGLALFLAVPVLLMVSGTLGVLPLTGVVTPFLSFGGSAMVANFAAVGLLASIRSDRERPADLDVFKWPVRCLGMALGTAAVLLLVAAARVQVVTADEIVVRPHLGLQADGLRRYQYNPRILDVARRIPRGTVLDRTGLALATDDRALLARLGPSYTQLGIAVDSACPDRTARCYPFGGRLFHVLGDAGTRRNWSASNTSFVERDSESKLRGFDDHATTVSVAEQDGTTGAAIRRDYRDLVPLLRHRYEAEHPAVKKAMDLRREVRLTLDARLQVRVSAILADYARRSASGRAAAVVIDPSSGDLLASVSYPWPSAADLKSVASSTGAESEPFLDRARYGLYPPGSTFKLITAAAGLRRDDTAADQRFTCSRLPDNRVGARVPGYTRPIRDDVMDRQPHGTIDLHRALTVSCNAYFAQLAVRVGPRALIDAAAPAGITLAKENNLRRIRDTLPQIGYGQGDVVVSPAVMARIAAAIAADGRIRDLRLDPSADAPVREFLPAQTARSLAQFMRDAVVDGTGRSVRGSDVPIAGKTGTAELDGAPSHSWFVAFAPYGSAERRIAVAVILENAGYGGAGAAPAAAEIVSAAAALGLTK